eukprot:SAG11_NODE_17988_length_503_cov_0.750000_1_plen_59_part_00
MTVPCLESAGRALMASAVPATLILTITLLSQIKPAARLRMAASGTVEIGMVPSAANIN